MFYSGVLPLSVFTDKDGVDIVVWRLVALDGYARPNVCEKVEGPPQSEVERNVAFTNCAIATVRSSFQQVIKTVDKLGVASGPASEKLGWQPSVYNTVLF